jgi:tetratricopeptide (TPR) repeat protein
MLKDEKKKLKTFIIFLIIGMCFTSAFFYKSFRRPIVDEETFNDLLPDNNKHPYIKKCNRIYGKYLKTLKMNDWKEAFNLLCSIYDILEKEASHVERAIVSLKIHQFLCLHRNKTFTKDIFSLELCGDILKDTDFYIHVCLLKFANLINSGRIKETINGLKELLEKKTIDESLRFQINEKLAYCYWLIGEDKKALKLIDECIKKRNLLLSPLPFLVKLKLVALIEQHEFEEAKALINKLRPNIAVRDDNIDRVTINQIEAFLYIKLNKFQEALDLLNNCHSLIGDQLPTKLSHINDILLLCVYTGLNDTESYNKIYRQSMNEKAYGVDKNMISLLFVEIIKLKIQKGQYYEVPVFLNKIFEVNDTRDALRIFFLANFYSGLFHINKGNLERANICFISAAGLAQALADDKIKALGYIGLSIMEFKNHRFETALIYADRSAQFVKEIKDYEISGYYFLLHGRILLVYGRCQESIHYFNKAMEDFSKVGNKRCITETHLFLSLAHLYTGNLDLSISYADNVISRGDESRIHHAQAYITKAVAYRHKGNMSLMEEIIKKAFDAAQETGDKNQMVTALIQSSLSQITMCNLKKAEVLLSECGKNLDPNFNKFAYCDLMTLYAVYFMYRNDRSKAEEKFQEAIARCRDSHYKWGEVRALYFRAEYYISISRFKEASDTVEMALQIARSCGFKVLEGLLVAIKGHIDLNNKEYEKSLIFFEEALEIGKEKGSGLVLGAAYYGLFVHELLYGNSEKSQHYAEQAMLHYKDGGDVFNYIKTERRVAVFNFFLDTTARDSLLSIYKIVCDKRLDSLQCVVLLSLAEAEIDFDSYEKAEKYIQEALSLLQGDYDTRNKIYAQRLLAHIKREQGDYSLAKQCCEEAIMLSKKISSLKEIFSSFYEMAKIQFKEKDYPRTLRFLAAIKNDFLKGDRDFFDLGRCYYLSGRIFIKLKQFDKAKENFEKALGYFKKVGNDFYRYKTEIEIIKVRNKIHDKTLKEKENKDFIAHIENKFDNKIFVVLGYLELTQLLERQGETNKALKIYEHILFYKPKITTLLLMHVYYKYSKFCARNNLIERATSLIDEAVFIAQKNKFLRVYEEKIIHMKEFLKLHIKDH